MTDFEQRYVTARKGVIARDLARLTAHYYDKEGEA